MPIPPAPIAAACALIGVLVLPTPSAAASVLRFQELWNFDDPAATEAAFRGKEGEVEAGGDLDALLQLKTQIARTLSLRGRFQEARALLAEVEAALPESPGTARVRWLLELGRTDNSAGSPQGARPRFEEAWTTARTLGLDGLAVDAAHMVAIASGEAEALAWNERALALATSSQDPDARRWVGSLANNTGWTHFEAGRHAEALGWFERALAARRETGDVARILEARWCVARAWRALGRLDEALVEQRALARDRAASGLAEDGTIHEELAELLLAGGDPEAARAHFAQAAALLGADPWLVEHEPERLARLKRLGAAASQAR